MINGQDLLVAGYRRYDAPTLDRQWCSGMFQKRIRDEEGRTRYFLNFRLWQFPDGHNRVSVEAQLYADPDVTFDLRRHISAEDTISMVEAFYNQAWILMKCSPDRHND